MACDAGLDIVRCFVHNVIDSFFRRDVFHGDLQGRKVPDQGLHDLLDEDRFPFEDVRVGDLRMDAQHHPHLLLQNRQAEKVGVQALNFHSVASNL